MPFPSTPILDSATQADSGPPTSANWSASTGLSGLSVTSNQFNSASGTRFSYWNPTTFGPDAECYATIATKGNNTELFAVYARLQQTSSFATLDGYTVFVTPAAGTDAFTVQRIDNGVGTTLGSTISQEIASGDAIGIEIIGSTIAAKYKASGGSWTELGTRTDSTYSSAGNIAMAMAGTVYRGDDFGGGTRVVSIAFEPALRRILPAINF